MENIGRREFIKSLLYAFPAIYIPEVASARYMNKKIHIVLPEIAPQIYHIQGKTKGGKIIIIGGIHGNEPGAYKAADILSQLSIKRGEIFVIPRSNPVSILDCVRGYNGDMNRKFMKILPKDPDYNNVIFLKQVINEVKPDAVLSLHDGFGFHILNKKFWGQCIVIDENEYGKYKLGRIGKTVANSVNKKIKKKRWKIPIFNTHTFSPHTKHPEQRHSLTYFCLSKCNVPAFCLEVSKQLPDLETKVRIHLMMINEFFRIFNIEMKPNLKTIIRDCKDWIREKKIYSAKLQINGRKVLISSNRIIKVPSKSEIQISSVEGSRGVNVIPTGVNLNWRRFTIRQNTVLKVKDDFEEVFNIGVIIV